MKILPSVAYCIFLLFIAVSTSLAQDMKPDAAKLYNTGNELLKAGSYKDAIANYDNALKIDQDYRIYYQRGIALKNSGKLEEAKNSFEASLKLKPEFEAGYNALGGVFFSMGKYQGAINNFESVLKFSKHNNIIAKVKNNLALAYTKLANNEINEGNVAKAIEHLNKAVGYSNYDAAYLSLAKIYSETSKYDKAISAAESALKYRSSIGKGGPYYYMAMAYKGKGDNVKAKEMFHKAKSDVTYKKLVEYELSMMK